MSKDQWIADFERLQDDFACGDIELEAFTKEMRWMGLDQPEIDEIVAEIMKDIENVPDVIQVGDHAPERKAL